MAEICNMFRVPLAGCEHRVRQQSVAGNRTKSLKDALQSNMHSGIGAELDIVKERRLSGGLYSGLRALVEGVLVIEGRSSSSASAPTSPSSLRSEKSMILTSTSASRLIASRTPSLCQEEPSNGEEDIVPRIPHKCQQIEDESTTISLASKELYAKHFPVISPRLDNHILAWKDVSFMFHRGCASVPAALTLKRSLSTKTNSAVSRSLESSQKDIKKRMTSEKERAGSSKPHQPAKADRVFHSNTRKRQRSETPSHEVPPGDSSADGDQDEDIALSSLLLRRRKTAMPRICTPAVPSGSSVQFPRSTASSAAGLVLDTSDNDTQDNPRQKKERAIAKRSEDCSAVPAGGKKRPKRKKTNSSLAQKALKRPYKHTVDTQTHDEWLRRERHREVDRRRLRSMAGSRNRLEAMLQADKVAFKPDYVSVLYAAADHVNKVRAQLLDAEEKREKLSRQYLVQSTKSSTRDSYKIKGRSGAEYLAPIANETPRTILSPGSTTAGRKSFADISHHLSEWNSKKLLQTPLTQPSPSSQSKTFVSEGGTFEQSLERKRMNTEDPSEKRIILLPLRQKSGRLCNGQGAGIRLPERTEINGRVTGSESDSRFSLKSSSSAQQSKTVDAIFTTPMMSRPGSLSFLGQYKSSTIIDTTSKSTSSAVEESAPKNLDSTVQRKDDTIRLPRLSSVTALSTTSIMSLSSAPMITQLLTPSTNQPTLRPSKRLRNGDEISQTTSLTGRQNTNISTIAPTNACSYHSIESLAARSHNGVARVPHSPASIRLVFTGDSFNTRSTAHQQKLHEGAFREQGIFSLQTRAGRHNDHSHRAAGHPSVGLSS